MNRMMLLYSISDLLQLNHRSSCTPHRILGVTIYSLTTTRPCTQCLHFWPQDRPSYRSMPLMLPILSSALTLLPLPLANLGRSQCVSRSLHHLLQVALSAFTCLELAPNMILHAIVNLLSCQAMLGHEGVRVFCQTTCTRLKPWDISTVCDVHARRRIPSSVEVTCRSLTSILAWHPICLSCHAITHGWRKKWILRFVLAAIASPFIQPYPIMLLQFWATRQQELSIVPPRSNSL